MDKVEKSSDARGHVFHLFQKCDILVNENDCEKKSKTTTRMEGKAQRVAARALSPTGDN